MQPASALSPCCTRAPAHRRAGTPCGAAKKRRGSGCGAPAGVGREGHGAPSHQAFADGGRRRLGWAWLTPLHQHQATELMTLRPLRNDGTAQHSTAQRSTAQHSAARTSIASRSRSSCRPVVLKERGAGGCANRPLCDCRGSVLRRGCGRSIHKWAESCGKLHNAWLLHHPGRIPVLTNRPGQPAARHPANRKRPQHPTASQLHPACCPGPGLTPGSRAGRTAGRTGSASACQTSTECPAPATAGRSAAPWAALGGGLAQRKRASHVCKRCCRAAIIGSCLLQAGRAAGQPHDPGRPRPTTAPPAPRPQSSTHKQACRPRLTQHFIAGVQHGGVVHQVPHVRGGAAVGIAVPAEENVGMRGTGVKQRANNTQMLLRRGRCRQLDTMCSAPQHWPAASAATHLPAVPLNLLVT